MPFPPAMPHAAAMTRRRLLLLLAALCLPGRLALAQTPVDVALVLAVDASGSISDGEFRLQKEGIAEALTDPEVVQRMLSGSLQRVALAYVEWGSPGGAETVVGWMLVERPADAEAVAQAILQAPRSSQSYNAMGDAIVQSTALLLACPCQATRRIIDLSGDNPDMRSRTPVQAARDAAVAQGITINGLAVLDGSAEGESAPLARYFEGNVIGGPGAFVITARDRGDIGRALRRKLVLEVATATPD